MFLEAVVGPSKISSLSAPFNPLHEPISVINDVKSTHTISPGIAGESVIVWFVLPSFPAAPPAS